MTGDLDRLFSSGENGGEDTASDTCLVRITGDDVLLAGIAVKEDGAIRLRRALHDYFSSGVDADFFL